MILKWQAHSKSIASSRTHKSTDRLHLPISNEDSVEFDFFWKRAILSSNQPDITNEATVLGFTLHGHAKSKNIQTTAEFVDD